MESKTNTSMISTISNESTSTQNTNSSGGTIEDDLKNFKFKPAVVNQIEKKVEPVQNFF